jgi:NAD(P)-dependent dehydrogenase (short-subunit alcohol dehydrogenase family)
MQDLAGKLAVITGGADGIGAALARRLGALGARLALIDIRSEAVGETAAALRAAGFEAAPFACDVSVAEDVERCADQVRSSQGEVSVVWGNAGLGIPNGILSAPRAALRWMYGVNLDGLIDTLRAFVTPMTNQSGWRWVGITGSMAGLVQVSGAGPAAYGASKYAAVGVAEALRAELDGSGVGVTLFCPGTINTRIWDGARARPDRFGGPRHAPEAAGERWRRIGMDVDQACGFAVEAMLRGEFYAVVPESRARGELIAERFAAIQAAVRFTSEPSGEPSS